MASRPSYASRAAVAAPLAQTSSVPVKSKLPNNTHVQVPAAVAGRSYGLPEVMFQSLEQRMRLDFGPQAFIFIAQPNGNPIPYIPENDSKKLQAGTTKWRPKTVSVNGLCAHAPVVKESVRANCKDEDRKVVTHVMLPEGDIEAYGILLGWIDDVNTTGIIKPLDLQTSIRQLRSTAS